MLKSDIVCRSYDNVYSVVSNAVKHYRYAETERSTMPGSLLTLLHANCESNCFQLQSDTLQLQLQLQLPAFVQVINHNYN